MTTITSTKMSMGMSTNGLPRFRIGQLASLAAFAALLVGCGAPPAVDTAELGKDYLSDQLPEEVRSLAESHAEFEDGMEVCVAGRIFSNLMSPFDPDSAAFNIIEMPKPGHDHENPGDCPFCKREMENAATAIVQLQDETGEVLKYSAEQLLSLSENQDVVVMGRASKVGEIMIISAEKVHALTDENASKLAVQIHEKLRGMNADKS